MLLAGGFAYKIKKPINLGFLDFSTLERRRYCCEEEIRLNCRLAPELYLDVVPITGSVAQPWLNGEGEAIEYAVRMRRFSQSDLMSENPPDLEMIGRIASRMARFHQEIPAADASTPFGTPEHVLHPMFDNFQQIRDAGVGEQELQRLGSLEAWTRSQAEQLTELMRQRKQTGHILECHGDLHLGNIATYQGRLEIFDGIEFNPELRWIDSLSDVAFLSMDLQHRGLRQEAALFLNDYLEQTGDYEALPLLRFYQLYRAMVRAKVTAIRLAQSGLDEAEQQRDQREFVAYLTLAEHYTQAPSTILLLTHGLSGSGKSLLSGWLAQRLPAIRLRSDVERQRLFVQGERGKPSGELGAGIYSAQATRATYAHLRKLAARLLQAGYAVIVDATFLKAQQREPFRQLADELAVPIILLDCQAPDAILRTRVASRMRQGTDASEADLRVLELQMQTREPLSETEQAWTLVVDSRQFPPAGLLERLGARIDKPNS